MLFLKLVQLEVHFNNLQVPRPDGKPDNLGLTMLDEPSLNQSDSTVLDLQLRAISKQIVNKEMVILEHFISNRGLR